MTKHSRNASFEADTPVPANAPTHTLERREPPASATRTRAAWLVALSMVAVAWGALGPAGAEDARQVIEPGLAAQLARGAEVYAFSCTTCHGATGQGFTEARAAFPADHYDCNRCHGPLNPPQMTPQQITESQTVFSLGQPPALADAGALARYGTAAGLSAYVRATMPRWYPGYLEDEAYLDVTAFVLDLAGMLPANATELTVDTLPTVALVAPPP